MGQIFGEQGNDGFPMLMTGSLVNLQKPSRVMPPFGMANVYNGLMDHLTVVSVHKLIRWYQGMARQLLNAHGTSEQGRPSPLHRAVLPLVATWPSPSLQPNRQKIFCRQ